MHPHSLLDNRLIPQPAFYAALGTSRSGGDKLKQNDPNFPKPIKFGKSRQAAVYYVVAEVEAYLAAKIAERDARYKKSAESHPCSPPQQPL
ncbi:AlpA family transcriptional regulator [Pseudomonas sp. PDM31]|uniref:helix-turn-helix transcriptional regulator n=1 Tax=Pseudomonas sp. PDM31 TaxID=2854778 RepID=UPI001C444832|nr:transcriptional regulator [Pseudomonas sp. PDM31]MBV7480342.1 transcriptional regulator [Pseudomonas sp. PDM31]